MTTWRGPDAARLLSDVGPAVARASALLATLAEAIVEAIPVQLLVADLADAAGLPKCESRYRQTDTKLATD